MRARVLTEGERFGRWTVTAALPSKNGRRMAMCRCDCGTERAVIVGMLVNRGGSCGCLKLEILAGRCTTHGHAGKDAETATYLTWMSMRDRCRNPSNPKWERYGGRGIVVCARWRDSFANFLADMGERPVGKTLDRKDNDGNYEPLNCRWATAQEQGQNQRTTKLSPGVVREIMDGRFRGRPSPAVALELGVSAEAVQHVRNGRTWSNVSDVRRKRVA